MKCKGFYVAVVSGHRLTDLQKIGAEIAYH